MDYLAWLDSKGRLKPCKNCGSKESLRHILVKPGDVGSQHYAKIVCDHCDGAFVQWGAHPEVDKARWPSEHRKLVQAARREGRTRCEMCLRHESDLPGTQSLMAHHVDEYQVQGEADLDSNVWILCTACHRLVHWARTYFGHYHLEEVPDAPGQ
jgi:hypothetical protein